jgi:hypothetical protein
VVSPTGNGNGRIGLPSEPDQLGRPEFRRRLPPPPLGVDELAHQRLRHRRSFRHLHPRRGANLIKVFTAVKWCNITCLSLSPVVTI